MGLFSGKTKHYVGTSVMRLIEDDKLPDSIKRGALTAITNNRSSESTDFVMEEFTTSLAIRAKRLYNYGANKYTYGLPSGNFVSETDALEQVSSILASIEKQPVTIEYSHFGAFNILHAGWAKLMSEYGYDPASNKLLSLVSPEGGAVYLQDMQVTVPTDSVSTFEQDEIAQWGVSPASGYTPERYYYGGPLSTVIPHSLILESNVISPGVTLIYCWDKKEKSIRQWKDWVNPEYLPNTATVFIPISNIDTGADFFHVKYSVNGTTKYWLYKFGSGTYPILDTFNEAAEDDVKGTFFPFTYFRYEKKSALDDKSTEAYEQSVKMMKYIGANFDDMAEGINESPDIKNVEQAMLMWAVPANTENALEQEYLYSFFDAMFYSTSNQEGTSLTSALIHGLLQNKYERPDRNILTIKDKRFTMTLSNGGVYKQKVVGQLGKIGTFTSGFETVETQKLYARKDKESGEITKKIVTVTEDYHYYRKQVAENLYDELRVVNLKTGFKVWGKYWSTGNDEGDILLVPLDMSLMKSFPLKDREVLYARSLHLVFNSHQVVHLKWYQTSIFKIFMVAVAIVITVVSCGTLTPVATAIVGALGIVVTTAIAVAIANILASILVGMLIKLFVKVVGVKIAFIAAIVAVCFGIAEAMNTGSLEGAPWAKELLSASSGLVNNSVSVYFKDKMDGLSAEIDKFEDLAETKTKELEAAQNLLEGNDLLAPIVVFGESPTEYFDRTIHSGNIGASTFDVLHNYVDIKLLLPTFNETIRGFA